MVTCPDCAADRLCDACFRRRQAVVAERLAALVWKPVELREGQR
jgi:hypothetical protein